MTSYEKLMARLGGHLAQQAKPVPVKVYAGRPIKIPACTLALWVENDRAWVGFEEARSLVSAQEIIGLLLVTRASPE